MSKKLLSLVLITCICASVFASGNQTTRIDNGQSGSNNSIVHKQKNSSYKNSAFTLIEQSFNTIQSMNVEAEINQNSNGRNRVAEQYLGGTNLTASIKQAKNFQIATQNIYGKGTEASIKQSGKLNVATQDVYGIDHIAEIEQLGREGQITQNINYGVQFDNLASQSFNEAYITQSSRSRKSSATQIITGFANYAEIEQNSGSNNDASQFISGQENTAVTAQTGSNNSASTTIEGQDNTVEVAQNGQANAIDVTILNGSVGQALNVMNEVTALQKGSSNMASVFIESSQGNMVTLKQDKNNGGNNIGTISIDQSDNNMVKLIQKGVNNEGHIMLAGGEGLYGNTNQGNTVILQQKGRNNYGTVDVSDCANSTVKLIQKGNGLNYDLVVSGVMSDVQVINQ